MIDHSNRYRVFRFVSKVSNLTVFYINIKCNVEKHTDTIEDLFKLSSTTKSLRNIHLYDSGGTIKKYKNIYEIFDEYYFTRYSLYVKRKEVSY